jgi:hypothetical protein
VNGKALLPAMAVAALLASAVGVSAAEQQATDYAPRGLPFGAFRAFPTIYTGIFYDDNVYRTQTGTISDVIYTLGGEIGVRSDWVRHSLNLSGAVQRFMYGDNSSEDRTEWRIGGDGRIDVLRAATVNVAASYTNLFELRNSANTPGFAAEPIGYRVAHLRGSFLYQPARLGFEVGGSLDDYGYSTTPLVGGGVVTNLDREHQEINLFARALYEFQPGVSMFARVGYNTREFDLPLDRNGQARDSDGYAIDAGMRMRLNALLEGEAYIGYLKQDYLAPLPDISGINYGATLTWYPTQLLTVRINAARRLVDTALAGASASDDKSFGVIFDYELLRNVLVTGHFDYIFSSFTGTTRKDDFMFTGIALRYLINRYLSASAAYIYSSRTSSVPGEDFDDNTLRANVNVHF